MLDRWCEAVGSVVTGTAVQQQTSDSAAPFAIVTWNTNVGSGDLVKVDRDLKAGRLTGGAPVHDYVLLLQEVTRIGPSVPATPPANVIQKRLGPSGKSVDDVSIDRLAAALGLHLVYAPAMRNGAGQADRGNAILSTLPLSRITVVELPFERQRRIAVTADVQLGSRALRLVTAHFETRAGMLRHGPASARQRQAEFLVAALSEVSEPEATIIGGDFNTSWGDDEPAVRILRRAYPDAPRTDGVTWGKAGISAKLDHLFARIPGATLKTWRVPDRFGSDHRPLVMTVELH